MYTKEEVAEQACLIMSGDNRPTLAEAIKELQLRHPGIFDEHLEKWIPVNKRMAPEGIEVILKSKSFIHPDFNPEGVRIGYRTEENYVTAMWCSVHDTYENQEVSLDDVEFWKSI